MSSAEIVVDGVQGADQIHSDIFQEFQTIFNRFKNLIGIVNYEQLTGISQLKSEIAAKLLQL
jgi:hypothetical protein